MKAFFCKIAVSFICIFSLSFSVCFALDKKEYPTSPPAKIVKKLRIGFLQGGPYKNYGRTIIPTVEGLAELGWCEKISLDAKQKAGEFPIEDIDSMWKWLASNLKSNYIEFVADAFYSNNWDAELRKKTKISLIKRLKEKKDIDLIIAMGTWAGQDLSNSEHSVPVIVMSTTSAVIAGIIKSIDDSGLDHVTARMQPKRHERQMRSLHDLIGFKKLGLIFINDPKDHGFSPVPSIREVAEDRKFEIVECHIPHSTDPDVNDKNVYECAKKIAPEIDAFHIIAQPPAINARTVSKIIEIMNKYKVPTNSQIGSSEVELGVLLTVANTSYKEVGMFHARKIANIFNGAKPRELEQVFEAPTKIAFNKTTAKKIDLRDDLYRLLMDVADDIYE